MQRCFLPKRIFATDTILKKTFLKNYGKFSNKFDLETEKKRNPCYFSLRIFTHLYYSIY